MSDYVQKGMSKGEAAEQQASAALRRREQLTGRELKHGAWIATARGELQIDPFRTPTFALVAVFAILYVGSVFLFESMGDLTSSLYALRIAVSTLFAVSLGVILSVWWQTTARFDEKIHEAERIDREYREHLLSFSDSLFDIINALNTLADRPPRPFVVATEFMLGEYVHLLQSQLQRYGDYVAGLGFDATAFLDEKTRIFDGIRERVGLSIKGMPKEVQSLFTEGLSLGTNKPHEPRAARQQSLQAKLKELSTGK